MCCALLCCAIGEEAKKLFDDAQRMLSDVVTNGLLHCAGVLGFWRANSVGDDIEMYDDDGSVVATFCGIRQQVLYQLRHHHFHYHTLSSGHILIRNVFRSATALSEPFANTAFGKQAFHCSAPATWNSLPHTVTDSDTLGTF